MFSGKTEELIRRMKRAKFARQRVEIFKPAIDTRYSEEDVVSHDSHSISLNDSFRFSREIFGGDPELMNRVIEQISVMSSYKTAVAFLASKVSVNEENEAMADFLELLKKYFNQSA